MGQECTDPSSHRFLDHGRLTRRGTPAVDDSDNGEEVPFVSTRDREVSDGGWKRENQ